MQREFVLIWHWSDGGNPSSYPVMARNRLEAYLRAIRSTEAEARRGLRCLDILDGGSITRASRLLSGRLTFERRVWS